MMGSATVRASGAKGNGRASAPVPPLTVGVGCCSLPVTNGVCMLRAAICGVGHWGLRLIQSVQGKSLKLSFTTAVTRDPASKHDLAPRYGLRLTAHYEEVIADPAIDAVVLATPHSQHAEQIVSAARA